MEHHAMAALRELFDVDEQRAHRKNEFSVDSRDVQLHYLYHKAMYNPSLENN